MRLHKEALVGDTKILIDKDLDLVKGDRILLADTSYYGLAGEDNFVEAYDATTGEVTLKTALKFYHWGKSESTKVKYGVDMRAEVALLTRNVLIQGDGIDGWGGQILTGSMIEANAELTER